jgi:hypothetical protein
VAILSGKRLGPYEILPNIGIALCAPCKVVFLRRFIKWLMSILSTNFSETAPPRRTGPHRCGQSLRGMPELVAIQLCAAEAVLSTSVTFLA